VSAGGEKASKKPMISSFRRVTPDPIRGGIQAFHQQLILQQKALDPAPVFTGVTRRGDIYKGFSH